MANSIVLSALRRAARVGKVGLFVTLAIVFGGDMLVKALGGAVDEKALASSAMPLILLFAFVGAGGEIALRTLAARTTDTKD